jgi:hypothetical protein
VGVIDREVVRETLAVGNPERLGTGEVDDPFRAACGVVVYRPQMNDRGTARCGPLHLAEVRQMLCSGTPTLPRWPVTRMRTPNMLSRIAAVCLRRQA